MEHEPRAPIHPEARRRQDARDKDVVAKDCLDNMAEADKLQAFEEDDEFEEFEQDDWDANVEDHYDLKQWEEDWDDESKEDDFTQHLRQELTRAS
mmetsp:Transcript_7583/g.14224  ORF Transcript_7583/g.14224 Transcript_7583/m.14224 type:complete len:95 (-) Transcript_7583:8041-8325(-)